MIFLKNVFDQYYLQEINRSTFNQAGATIIFERFFKHQLFKENTIYLIVGSDSGLLPRHIEQQGIPEGSTYCFIESPEVLEALNHHPQPMTFSENILFCQPEEWEEVLIQHKLIERLITRKVQLIRSVSVIDQHFEPYSKIYATTENSLNQLRWKLSGEINGATFIQNQIKNICENKIPARILQQQFKGTTAILLAGGPSLDDVLPWVIANQHQLLIVAVSRICRRLKEVGLSPHIIVTIDPSEKSYTVSKEMLDFADESLLVAAYHTTPLLLSNWSTRSLYLGTHQPWDDISKHGNWPVYGPTVSNSAILMLTEMGVGRILLAGLDLSFTKLGVTHAQGSNERDAGPKIEFVGHQIELNNGEQGETDAAFFEGISTIGKQAQYALEKNCQLINLSSNAAKIPYVAFKNPDEISLTELTESPTSRLNKIIESSNQLPENEYLLNCKKDLLNTQNKLSSLIQNCNKALKLNSEMSSDNQKNTKINKKLSQVETTINCQYKELLSVIKLYRFAYFAGLFNNQQQSLQDIKRATSSYLRAYKHGAQDLKTQLNKALSRIEARLNELNPNPNIEILIEQWKEDGSFKRGRDWYKKVSPSIQLTQEDHKILEQFFAQEQAFDDQHKAKNTGEFTIKKIKSIEHKLNIHLKSKDTKTLKQMAEHLKSINQPNTQPLADLAFGYVAELEGDLDNAITHYHQATNGECVETALNKLTQLLIALKDYDNALVALECLTGLSSSYLREYSKFCYAIGKTDEAIAAYEQYLRDAPDDTRAMYHLSKMFIEQQQKESARPLLNRILEIYPNNPSASKLLAELNQ